jgi:hypothetical protein
MRAKDAEATGLKAKDSKKKDLKKKVLAGTLRHRRAAAHALYALEQYALEHRSPDKRLGSTLTTMELQNVRIGSDTTPQQVNGW